MISISGAKSRCSGLNCHGHHPDPSPIKTSIGGVGNCEGTFKMKTARTFLRRSARLIAIVPFAAFLYSPSPAAAAPFLGTAEQFAVLGASDVTNTTATTINGDVGVYPGSSITGTADITLIGASTYHVTDAVAMGAQADSTTAYTALMGMSPTMNLTGDDLGGLTLMPGVYKFDSSAQLTGTLTLDFDSEPNVPFVFQIGSTLTTASASVVDVLNGDSDSAIYWQVGSSATLGTTTVFAGNIIAQASVSLDTNAQILCGRAIALTGGVTLEDNTISNDCNAYNAGTGRTDFSSTGFSGVTSTVPAPEPGSALIVITGLIGLAALERARAQRSAR